MKKIDQVRKRFFDEGIIAILLSSIVPLIISIGYIIFN